MDHNREDSAKQMRISLRKPMQAPNVLSFVILHYFIHNPAKAPNTDLIEDVDDMLSMLRELMADLASVAPTRCSMDLANHEIADTYNMLQCLRSRHYMQEHRPDGKLVRGLKVTR